MLVLDTSGSMAGSPMRALQAGCKLIGDAFYQDVEQPYEKMYIMEYNSAAKVKEVKSKDEFVSSIDNLKAGGGTNFY